MTPDLSILLQKAPCGLIPMAGAGRIRTTRSSKAARRAANRMLAQRPGAVSLTEILHQVIPGESQSKPGRKMVDPAAETISGWDCPLLTFTYPGFDGGSRCPNKRSACAASSSALCLRLQRRWSPRHEPAYGRATVEPRLIWFACA